MKNLISSEGLDDFNEENRKLQKKFRKNSLILNYINNHLIDDIIYIRDYSSKFYTNKFEAFRGKVATNRKPSITSQNL